MSKICFLNENTKKWMEMKDYQRSKKYRLFYDFVAKECDNNLEGFLIGILFYTKNRRIGAIKTAIKDYLCDSLHDLLFL
jgi:hypothetical protein